MDFGTVTVPNLLLDLLEKNYNIIYFKVQDKLGRQDSLFNRINLVRAFTLVQVGAKMPSFHVNVLKSRIILPRNVNMKLRIVNKAIPSAFTCQCVRCLRAI